MDSTLQSNNGRFDIFLDRRHPIDVGEPVRIWIGSLSDGPYLLYYRLQDWSEKPRKNR